MEHYSDLDALIFIDNPFVEKKDSDVLSLIFHRFYRYTDIPVVLPIFSLFGIISAWTVFANVRYKISNIEKEYDTNTWVLLLAPSGCSKTLCFEQIQSMIPRNEVNEPIVTPNINKPSGPKAMIMQLAELAHGRGFWVLDEAAQMLKLIETPGSPMAELKEILLKTKDGTRIERHNSKEHFIVEKIVMTQLFLNTISSMVDSVSNESMVDGLIRRYQIAIAEKDQRKFTDFPIYRLQKIVDEKMKQKIGQIFHQQINGLLYTFSPAAENAYSTMFGTIWEKEFAQAAPEIEGYYRTYLMEAWKYAIFHHLIYKKKGTVISTDSMEFGLKVVVFLLRSLAKFLQLKNFTKSQETGINTEKAKAERMYIYITENEKKKNFGMSSIYRKFHLKKEQAVKYLQIIKADRPNFKSKLFRVAGLETEKNY